MTAFPKAQPVRSEAYRRAVASLRCWRCHVEGFSQAAHSNVRGLGQKSCDLTCYPLCSTRPGVIGCHVETDQLIGMTLHERREQELKAAADTQSTLIAVSLVDAKLRATLRKVRLVA